MTDREAIEYFEAIFETEVLGKIDIEAMNIAISALREREERAMNWISVKERLPEEWVSVLGFMPDSRPYHPVRECYRIPGKEKFFFPALHGYMPITHWAEMPEPPKEEA